MERLCDEVRHDPSITRAKPWAIGVEDPNDARIDPRDPPVGHKQRFSVPFGFVINASRPDGIHISPVLLALGSLQWVTVNLTCGREQDTAVVCSGKLNDELASVAPDAQRLYREPLVIIG